MKRYSTEDLAAKELKLIEIEQRREKRKEKARPKLEKLLLRSFEKNWQDAEKNIQQMLIDSPSLKDALFKNGLANDGISIDFDYIGPSMRNYPFYYQIIIALNKLQSVEIMIYRKNQGPNRFPFDIFSYRSVSSFSDQIGKPNSLPESTRILASEIFQKLLLPKTAVPVLLREASSL